MGVYVDKFRELIESLPKTPEDFKHPVHAASAMATMMNATLQCLASLEEALEDAQKENERLQEMLIDADKGDLTTPGWWPKS